MSSTLSQIESIINGDTYANDSARAFTYIEFVKAFGITDEVNDFLGDYKEYLLQWQDAKRKVGVQTTEEYVEEQMIDMLKSITLDYSTYEEQAFLANLDWTNITEVKAVIPLYVKKIKEITDFYRNKRNEAHLIVEKNAQKGSYKNIQEIIYQKIIDYIFDNKNVQLSYQNIKNDLTVSVEQFVDTYSEYFDIPRDEDLQDSLRADYLEANQNDPDWRDYLKIHSQISQIIYDGKMYLKQIPLIATLGLDLASECTGDLQNLRNVLISQVTLNRIPLNEQIDLRRRLYEKYLGCDLYYLYVDSSGNKKMDVLCTAKNPSGNLLNCATADRAVIPVNQQLKLLTQIGLYFKPDKQSLLKVSAKDYTWEIDDTKIKKSSIYVFPDPSKYGDIGNTKLSSYPLIMRYHLDYDIKNISSGDASDDPLCLLGDQTWRTYYSQQQRDFVNCTNYDYEYAFTSLVNAGLITNYFKDSYGIQYGLLKGYYEKTEEGITKKYFYPLSNFRDFSEPYNEEQKVYKGVLLNGGYYGIEGTLWNNFKNKIIYERSNDIAYSWSGVKMSKNKPLIVPRSLFKYINLGKFSNESTLPYVWTRNYDISKTNSVYSVNQDNVISTRLSNTLTVLFGESELMEDGDWKTSEQMKQTSGDLYVKLSQEKSSKVLKFEDAFKWVKDLSLASIINFQVNNEILFLETTDEYAFIPYAYDGTKVYDTLEKYIQHTTISKDTREYTVYITIESGIKTYSFKDVSTGNYVPLSSSVYYTLAQYCKDREGTEEEVKNEQNITVEVPVDYNQTIIIPKETDGSSKNLYTYIENEKCIYIATLKYMSYDQKSAYLPTIYKVNLKDYTVTLVIDPLDINYETYTSLWELNGYYRKYNGVDTIKKRQEAINNFLKDDDNVQNMINYLEEDESYQNFINVYSIDMTSINGCLSYNSFIDKFLIAYTSIDDNGIPYIYEHQFRLNTNDSFDNTLSTNVYHLSFSTDDLMNSYNSDDISRIKINYQSIDNVIFSLANGTEPANIPDPGKPDRGTEDDSGDTSFDTYPYRLTIHAVDIDDETHEVNLSELIDNSKILLTNGTYFTLKDTYVQWYNDGQQYYQTDVLKDITWKYTKSTKNNRKIFVYHKQLVNTVENSNFELRMTFNQEDGSVLRMYSQKPSTSGLKDSLPRTIEILQKEEK